MRVDAGSDLSGWLGLCGTRHKTQRLTTDVAVMRPSGCQLPLSFIEKKGEKKEKKKGIIFLNFASQLQNFAKGLFFFFSLAAECEPGDQMKPLS